MERKAEDGERDGVKEKDYQTMPERERDGRSERKEAADRACAATAKLRSQVLVHGRNGRVDRFPSLGSVRPTPSRPVGGPEWRKHPRGGGKQGKQRGRGGQTDGSLARRAVQCRACASRSPPLSLSPSLSFLHEDSTRCDRNLCRRSERAGNRESDKGCGKRRDRG